MSHASMSHSRQTCRLSMLSSSPALALWEIWPSGAVENEEHWRWPGEISPSVLYCCWTSTMAEGTAVNAKQGMHMSGTHAGRAFSADADADGLH